jgi:chitinase
MCLSQHGFCGTSDAYCGVGCRAGPCYGGAITSPPVVTGTFPSVGTSTLPPVATGTLPSVATGTLPSVATGTLPSVSTTGLPSGVDDHSGDGTFYDRK